MRVLSKIKSVYSHFDSSRPSVCGINNYYFPEGW
jgi:hypothetical protein